MPQQGLSQPGFPERRMRFTSRSSVGRRPHASGQPEAWGPGDQRAIRQGCNVASDAFVHDAWARGQTISVRGWAHSLRTGLVNDLGMTVGGLEPFCRLTAPRLSQTGPFSAAAA